MPYYNSASHGNSIYSKEGGGPSSVASAAAAKTVESSYVMEHLATFTVTKETGIVYPADGMRRLLQLEKSNGIWSQKMQMRLERNWVLIMDNETGVSDERGEVVQKPGAVMERFPAGLIQEPTAFTSRDPMEMYNNILVFTVTDDSPAQRAEMHIFQCQSVSAQDLVEDLKMLQAGKLTAAGSPRASRAHIPPPPALPPPEPPLNGAAHFGEGSSQQQQQPAEEGSREDNCADEVSSTSSDKYERDVTVLNHCFDDIEKFIARLQHAAAASRELERRRRNRKSKKRNLGDGMLTMRAKPPPELEFVDIFQKFKLSFNLLAKLKAHIHDPNAPELVHFLFTPLALIVDASHEGGYEAASLPAKVVSPLLSREAVNLLMNCVSSKETELWHSLGDAWLVPREQWKGHVPPYHPVFMDGWSPDCPPGPPDEQLASLLSADKRKRELQPHEAYYEHREPDESHYSSDYLDYESREERAAQEYFEREAGPEARDRERAHSDISLDSIERAGPRDACAWLDELLARRAKVVQVTYPRTANNDKELTVVRGELLEVLDDSRKWWKARNSRGQVAHVPHTIVTTHEPAEAADLAGFGGPLYAARYPRQASHGYAYEDSEIDAANTSPGSDPPHRASHAIPPPAPADWVRKERLGKKGFDSDESFYSCISKVSDDDYVETSTSREVDSKTNQTMPPPPPPPLHPPTLSNKKKIPMISKRAAPLDSSSRIDPSLSSQHQRNQIHEELKHVLTMLIEKKKTADFGDTVEKQLPYKKHE